MGRGAGPTPREIVIVMELISTVLSIAALLVGVGLLVVMAMLPWLERLEERS